MNKAETAHAVEIAGKALKCFFCEHDQFTERRVLLANAAATLLGLGFTGPQAMCYVCEKCGHVHWFRAKGRRG